MIGTIRRLSQVLLTLRVNKRLPLFLMMLLPPLLGGCVAAGVGLAAGGGALIANDRRTAGTIVEDQAIELKALNAFFNDQAIRESSHVNVTCYNSIVLVTGETPDEGLRKHIIDIVRNIPKVTSVYDELTIAAPSSLTSRSSDSLITSKVKTKLIASQEVDAGRIKVVTEKGAVYLMGLVSEDEADNATRITRETGGVQKVVKIFQYVDDAKE